MSLTCSEEIILIETYPEAERESLPMFAENRSHQRTSGNPYPNKVVLRAQRDVREKREYTLIRLRNDYLEIGILPALGGKILYADDLRNGQPLFYHNHVVKPALIGALGSWTSGGIEFNWPYHHRPSTFMPVDYAVERKEGEIVVWLSEHDPVDRMKGMVGVRLREGECIFSTLAKLDNPTPLRHSFLWWENAAVPVGENYRIFFPEDVNYARFHYKTSVIPFPLSDGRFYNGRYVPAGLDLRKHASTRPATSYFSASSRFDFFGGYDDAKQAGVVHVADHAVSPGKKLFTWGYERLAKAWERALTDDDGAYAELMAGCYSDNQPDFSILEPYETKSFTQNWFPIHGKGAPVFASEHGALFREDGALWFESVRPLACTATLEGGGRRTVRKFELPAYENVLLFSEVPQGSILTVAAEGTGETLFRYELDCVRAREIPAPREEFPDYRTVRSAEELYLEGLHFWQYRAPEGGAETYFKEALKRDAEHAPSLMALAEFALARGSLWEALDYALRAVKRLTRFNARTESGRAYYLAGLALLGTGDAEGAYEAFSHAAWCRDTVRPAGVRLGMLDLAAGDVSRAEEKLKGTDVVSEALAGWCRFRRTGSEEGLTDALRCDRLNLYALALLCAARGDFSDFCAVRTDLTQDALDVAEVMLGAGLKEETAALLRACIAGGAGDSVRYLFAMLTGEKTAFVGEGIAFPHRPAEEAALRYAIGRDPSDGRARFLLGCLLYGARRYGEGKEQFALAAADGTDPRALRCLAVAEYGDGRKREAERLLARAEALAPEEKQLTFERTLVAFRTGRSPRAIARHLEAHGYDRDDLTVELARAYNLCGEPDRALSVLLSRKFVACEGGEHYIADQYAYAHYLKGRDRYLAGDYAGAREEFRAAVAFPELLGAAFWNAARGVPFRYFEGRCEEKLGNAEAARDIYREIAAYPFETFVLMYLPVVGYYKAQCMRLLGDDGWKEVAATRTETAKRGLKGADAGSFSTTPFFISYREGPASERKVFWAYELMLLARLTGDDAGQWRRIVSRDRYNLRIEDFTE